MKLYAFEGLDPTLPLLPLAARRALDAAGLKLSLEAWRGLAVQRRQRVAELGSSHTVSPDEVAQCVLEASPAPRAMPPHGELEAARVPTELRQTYAEASLPDAVWSALSPLDRYALAKVAVRSEEPRIGAALAEIVGHSATSTHVGPSGGVRMVRVASKPATLRSARAESRVTMSDAAFERLRANSVPKGDVLSTARLAAIMAAKRTAELIPLCHVVSLTHVNVTIELKTELRLVHIEAEAEALDRTGVEMEALVAASTAALVVYDMLKAFDRSMVVGPTRLLSKTGGRSGDFEGQSS